jgi:hypothetical protein
MTVASRRFASTPARDASETWDAIVVLLTRGKSGANGDALAAVAGVAASIIADQAPRDAAIVVTCDGPRTRIYCLYDDDATDGSDADEGTLGFDPLAGDWAVSLPCDRVTARDKAATIAVDEEATGKAAAPLVLNPKGFLGQ